MEIAGDDFLQIQMGKVNKRSKSSASLEIFHEKISKGLLQLTTPPSNDKPKVERVQRSNAPSPARLPLSAYLTDATKRVPKSIFYPNEASHVDPPPKFLNSSEPSKKKSISSKEISPANMMKPYGWEDE
mmetsp:Transcript_8493/g.13014  ORF Transcript_8493/g.13014 Transcript_8493/m.13014 type:complete len:129 (+) Transcript_8493:2807-3193(+)